VWRKTGEVRTGLVAGTWTVLIAKSRCSPPKCSLTLTITSPNMLPATLVANSARKSFSYQTQSECTELAGWNAYGPNRPARAYTGHEQSVQSTMSLTDALSFCPLWGAISSG
jgi:hypothetical protein